MYVFPLKVSAQKNAQFQLKIGTTLQKQCSMIIRVTAPNGHTSFLYCKLLLTRRTRHQRHTSSGVASDISESSCHVANAAYAASPCAHVNCSVQFAPVWTLGFPLTVFATRILPTAFHLIRTLFESFRRRITDFRDRKLRFR